MIVFVTTCKGRTEHIKQTLPKNLADNVDYKDCKFLVLDYGDPGDLRELIECHVNELKSGRVVYYRYNADGPFHVSHAKNMAARCGILEGADILVTLDADNYTGPGFAQHIADRFGQVERNKDFNERLHWGEFPSIFMVPNHLHIQSLPHGPGRPCRGFAGRLAIRSQDFIKMGGYDETFNTWRGEDIDLMFRLKNIGYTLEFIDNKYLETIPHPASVRFKEYPEARQYENPDEVKIIRARKESVVNFGKFGIGTVYRNFGTAPIELGPVPTRIFGIGLHKTGTTSLHKAFQILGYDSLHWGTGEAGMIWREMHSAGRSKTLEQWYALSDLPIPLLYQKLDAAYPGSKFILTLRDEADWLKSVERLWDPKFNPTRNMWDTWQFPHKIHRALYGRQTFDAETFLARYRRHTTEVLDYFSRRRYNDVLVMNMSVGAGWKELCGFLGEPVPGVPYPHQHKTPKPEPVINYIAEPPEKKSTNLLSVYAPGVGIAQYTEDEIPHSPAVSSQSGVPNQGVGGKSRATGSLGQAKGVPTGGQSPSGSLSGLPYAYQGETMDALLVKIEALLSKIELLKTNFSEVPVQKESDILPGIVQIHSLEWAALESKARVSDQWRKAASDWEETYKLEALKAKDLMSKHIAASDAYSELEGIVKPYTRLRSPESSVVHMTRNAIANLKASNESLASFVASTELTTVVNADTNGRSLIKAISYRILGSTATGLLVLLVTGKWKWAAGVGVLDAIAKVCMYFVHERVWDKIKFGRTNEVKEAKVNAG